jgi:beta-galactosidase/beta-glucuronidase
MSPGITEREPWPTDHPDYPRRGSQRRDWQNLNGTWDFTIDPDGAVTHPRNIPRWDQRIEVPFAPESERSGVNDRGFHADVWYRRAFAFETVGDHRVLLHFGAVDYRAEVWIDDNFVGSHEGGHTSFSFDITDALAPGSEHTVSVWAHDDPNGLAQPRGKQDWQLEPHSIWYPRTTGIWQTVWLEEVPEQHLRTVRLVPRIEAWAIGCEVQVQDHTRATLEVRVQLRAGDRVLATDRYAVHDNEVHRRIALSDPGIDDFRNELLWTPENPNLILADIELLKDGEVVDRMRSYTAMRGVSLQRGRLLLNNRPYYLRLLLDQGYWPESLMTPPSEEAIIRDIELVKAAGFNGVRKHQKIEDPRWLYWADVLGLVVWEEMPSAYRFTRASIERLTREWMEVLERDAHHPCIVLWVPFNESWGVPNLPDVASHRSWVQSLYHLTRTIDPTRPVIGNDGWESSATDIVGIHDYDDNAQRLLERYTGREGADTIPHLLINGWPGGRVLTLDGHPHEGQPIMLTEFGGIAYDERKDVSGAWGYSVTTDADDLRRRYEQLLEAVNRIEDFSGFCYTQFADTYQEKNGLFFDDRTPKFDLEAMRAATVAVPWLPHEVAVADVEN